MNRVETAYLFPVIPILTFTTRSDTGDLEVLVT